MFDKTPLPSPSRIIAVMLFIIFADKYVVHFISDRALCDIVKGRTGLDKWDLTLRGQKTLSGNVIKS